MTRERVGFPPGVPAWVDLAPGDLAAAMAFYGPLFGWTFDERPADDASTGYVVASLEGRAAAGLRPTDAAGAAGAPTAWMTYIGTDDAAVSLARVQDAGGSVVSGPAEIGDGIARTAICVDPSGTVFGLWEPGSIRGADVVNAPGSWNFSELNTDDRDAAERFYGAVFGWAFSEVEFGGTSTVMVRLPGYADFLEQFDPGIRQRHADFGAPPGFSDSVGWVRPLDGRSTPHWSITFAVADANDVAARAPGLGGSVASEPFDIGPVRSAVLLDPAGAQLTASAFRPDAASS